MLLIVIYNNLKLLNLERENRNYQDVGEENQYVFLLYQAIDQACIVYTQMIHNLSFKN